MKEEEIKIYYADLTPCDDMHNYMKAAFVPAFVKEDTHLFDDEPPIGVVQVATCFGWCIQVRKCPDGGD